MFCFSKIKKKSFKDASKGKTEIITNSDASKEYAEEIMSAAASKGSLTSNVLHFLLQNQKSEEIAIYMVRCYFEKCMNGISFNNDVAKGLYYVSKNESYKESEFDILLSAIQNEKNFAENFENESDDGCSSEPQDLKKTILDYNGEEDFCQYVLGVLGQYPEGSIAYYFAEGLTLSLVE